MFTEFENEELINDEDLFVSAFDNGSESSERSNVSDSCCC